MTALPLSASSDAPCDCETCAAPIAPPATLPTEVRAYVTGQPDALLVTFRQLADVLRDHIAQPAHFHDMANPLAAAAISAAAQRQRNVEPNEQG